MLKTFACALLIAGAAIPAEAATVLGAGQANGARLSSLFTRAPQQGQLEQREGDPAPAPAPAPIVVEGDGTAITQHVGWSGANSFVLSYDAATDVLTSTINGGPSVVRAHFLASLAPAYAGQRFDQLTVGVRDPATGAFVQLSELTLNGVAVEALNGYDGAGFRFWSVDGQDFRDSFTLTGTLSLDGARIAPDLDGSAVQFIVGTNPIPEPGTWALMIGGFALLGAVLRRRRRNKRALA